MAVTCVQPLGVGDRRPSPIVLLALDEPRLRIPMPFKQRVLSALLDEKLVEGGAATL